MSNKTSHIDPKIKFAGIVSLLVAITLFSIKLIAFRLTHSQALFSEAMESIVNVLAAIMALFVLYFSAKPADREHPYGHGKIEYISAAIEGGLIAFAAFIIIVEAIQAFFEDKPLNSLSLGLVLLASTGVINLLVGFYLKSLGNKKHSPALVASGTHLVADFWTTAGVLVGLGLVLMTKIIWLDRVVAVFVSLHLVKEGYALIRQSVGGLLDEENSELIEKLQSVINETNYEGIIQVHHLRVMRSGAYHHIDAHVVVPEFWSVNEAHDHTIAYEKQLIQKYDFSGEIHFHLDPCRKLYCKFCDLQNCSIRQEKFEQKRRLTLKELVDKDEPREITKKI